MLLITRSFTAWPLSLPNRRMLSCTFFNAPLMEVLNLLLSRRFARGNAMGHVSGNAVGTVMMSSFVLFGALVNRQGARGPGMAG